MHQSRLRSNCVVASRLGPCCLCCTKFIAPRGLRTETDPSTKPSPYAFPTHGRRFNSAQIYPGKSGRIALSPASAIASERVRQGRMQTRDFRQILQRATELCAEVMVRMNAVDMLELGGFSVLEAANADEAIALLETHSDVAAIFTDIDMPGSMNGIKLAHAVRGRWPPIKIIATSGHFKVSDGDLPSGGRFLPKPYSFNEVVGALRELTNSG